jgi:cell division protein FtsL
MTARISPFLHDGTGAPTRAPKVDLSVVAEQRRRASVRAGVLTGLGVFIVMFIMLASYTMIIGQQRNLDSLNRQIATEQHNAQDLNAQIAQLQSPVRVTSDAAALLGMVPAPTPVYLEPRADDDQRAAEIPEATAATR